MRFFVFVFVYVSAIVAQAQPNYDYDHMHREQLGRGLIVFADDHSDSVVFSWRWLKADSPATAFNLYAGTQRLNTKLITQATFYKISASSLPLETGCDFSLVPVIDGREVAEKRSTSYVQNLRQPYFSIPLQRPAEGTTPDGQRYTYSANDASVGDVDGDGEYEIILKWEPSNAHDNSHEGYTGNVLFDCYTLDGKQLWRIDLGPNIRAGAHYTQFMVYDFDSDGKAELMMKTADGTIDGTGTCIGDSSKDYRFSGTIDRQIRGKMDGKPSNVIGRILQGHEYLTVFEGLTGKALATTDYIPSRGNVADWGDNYGNRSERYLACVAYLDGIHPSAVFCRGYYTRTVLAAWDWDGTALQSRWVFDTNQEPWNNYAGQGNHNLRVADVDADGCDEITYGSMAVDHDGTGLYNTGMGHGDALHLMPFYPDSLQLQVWDIHENRRDGSDFRDARTGRIIFQIPSGDDVGRGMAADIDPTNPGVEMWSLNSRGILNARWKVIASDAWVPVNFAVWWDGDLLREMLDRETVSKYDWHKHRTLPILKLSPQCSFNNGTKSNPCLSADVLGDWREEIVVRTADNTQLRIYSTPIPTDYRIPCLMEDIPYRHSVATQNVGYNQPPETGFYLGE